MEKIALGNGELTSSRLAYGCMRIIGDGSAEARKRGLLALHAAMENGYTLFDNADIYGDGACEALFGEFLMQSKAARDDLIVATKCGIRFKPKRYDFRRNYIIGCAEGSLKRMGIEQIDLFMLHRPDYLMDLDEVAAAFETLRSSGKVAHFGVSNFSPSRLSLLRSRIDVPLLVNQVEINIHNITALDDGTLDQCQDLNITPQAWCPVAGVVYPAWGNTFSAADELRIRAEFNRQAKAYRAEDWIVVLAWLLMHPATISPIIGSTSPERIAAATGALGVEYRREDWYRLLEARRGQAAP